MGGRQVEAGWAVCHQLQASVGQLCQVAHHLEGLEAGLSVTVWVVSHPAWCAEYWLTVLMFYVFLVSVMMMNQSSGVCCPTEHNTTPADGNNRFKKPEAGSQCRGLSKKVVDEYFKRPSSDSKIQGL